MSDPRDVLDRITIASPCTQDWDAMTGDEKRRFCGECRLHVHDVSQMTRREAQALLANADGRVCVRLWRRPDGRVLTKDCVTVRERLRRRVRVLRTAAAALFAMLLPLAAGCGGATTGDAPTTGVPVVPEDGPEMGEPLMGDVSIEPADPQPTMGTPAAPTDD